MGDREWHRQPPWPTRIVTAMSAGVLYVGHDNQNPDMFCPGSIVCMSLAERLQPDITIQDCSVLRKSQDLPAWLDGTPIYVHEEDAVPRRGYDAVHYLNELVRSRRRSGISGSTIETGMHRPATAPASPLTPSSPPASPVFDGRSALEPSINAGVDDDSRASQGIMDVFAPVAGTGPQLTRNDKVTNSDLEKFIEARKVSDAAEKRN